MTTKKKRGFAFKIAGISFENRQKIAKECRVGESVEFIREPQNPFDRNAIAIYVQHKEDRKDMLGYVPRTMTKFLKEKTIGMIRNIAGSEKGTIGIVIEIPRKTQQIS